MLFFPWYAFRENDYKCRKLSHSLSSGTLSAHIHFVSYTNCVDHSMLSCLLDNGENYFRYRSDML